VEREWKAGLLEEEAYKRLMKELMNKREATEQHPFRRFVEASATIYRPT
jgi:hypothetical protein